jgi:lipoate-protein ligase B
MPPDNSQRFFFRNLGLQNYESTWQLQKSLVSERAQERVPDTILLVEHPPVFTFGRTASQEQFIVPYDQERGRAGDIPVVRIDRGGGTTYHGPGQSVIYPIIGLKIREQRLHWLLRCYEEIVIEALRCCGVPAKRESGNTGVWSSQGKIASIGIGIKHWITYHGIAVNINTNLRPFTFIHPCGLKGCQIVNAAALCNSRITVKDFNNVLKAIFEKAWNEFWNGALRARETIRANASIAQNSSSQLRMP